VSFAERNGGNPFFGDGLELFVAPEQFPSARENLLLVRQLIVAGIE